MVIYSVFSSGFTGERAQIRSLGCASTIAELMSNESQAGCSCQAHSLTW